MYRNLRLVPQLIYGRGSINQLGDILTKQRTDAGSPAVFLIDSVHGRTGPGGRHRPSRSN